VKGGDVDHPGRCDEHDRAERRLRQEPEHWCQYQQRDRHEPGRDEVRELGPGRRVGYQEAARLARAGGVALQQPGPDTPGREADELAPT
jgi:hypothetical protein